MVTMCCYAPLMARYGLDQWTPDLIWFDGTRVVRTPNYYIQQMFSEFRGKQVLSSRLTDEDGTELRETASGIYQTAAAAGGTVCVKIVNVSGEKKELTVYLQGMETHGETAGSLTVLAGGKQDTNGLSGEKVKPEKTEIRFERGYAKIVLPGYAAAVLAYPEGGQ